MVVAASSPALAYCHDAPEGARAGHLIATAEESSAHVGGTPITADVPLTPVAGPGVSQDNFEWRNVSSRDRQGNGHLHITDRAKGVDG